MAPGVRIPPSPLVILMGWEHIRPGVQISVPIRSMVGIRSGGSPVAEMRQRAFALKKAHCSSCTAPTNHFVIAERKQAGRDEEYDVSRSTTYQMLECCGCELVSSKATELSA